MREITLQVYKFSELSEQAKERAREWYRQAEAELFGAHGELWEPAETAAKLLGITFDTHEVKLIKGTRTEPKIWWSGFSSQGDGASWVGRYEYRRGCVRAIVKEFPTDVELRRITKLLAELQARNGYKLSATITQRRDAYVHSGTMDAEVLKGEEIATPEIAEEVLGLMRHFADWIYSGLREQYEYRMSDEAVDESIEANEYEFYQDGRRA